MNFSAGETIDAYRILEELGRGGMGRVFKVEHVITRRLEAMKVLEGGRPGEPEQAARSLREIQLQASLDHPNIAAVHNAFCAGDSLVLVMELIDGRSLRSVLDAQRLPLDAVLDYAGQALAALGYAHAHGVMHRDLSPANMMIGPSGILKLTDFGLAKRLADVQLSHSGAPLGSFHYMSPEQVRGAEAGACSDIYSLGAVLYELSTGRKPFDGDSAFAIMADQIGALPAAPVTIEPGLPQALNHAILRALEKDPAQRFASAEEFLRALTTVPAAVRSRKPSPSRPRSRSRMIWAAAALGAVSVAMGGLIGSREWHPRSHPPAANFVTPAPIIPARADAPPVLPATVLSPPVALPGVSAAVPAATPVLRTKQPGAAVSPKETPTPTAFAREPVSVAAPASESPVQQPPEAAQAPPVPAKEGSEAAAKPARNPVVKVLGRIWHLGRRQQPYSPDESGRAPASPEP